ncbi:threonine synthase [Halodesulfovibrio marinisediminis]|uniref:Threonine synthase n=1 Tax=Halodesulfovibrio marinisediminis DSM 17456 TaxID=1121457 RepID=A0A1N6F6B1_9BACT|nr:threonine synthase [Halodesulfovibrio marinisediminis]SIN90779.1 L-threonine synthase [Halodesulfovibrio marinisediminis DSM 17456]
MKNASVFPEYRGEMEYYCLGCGKHFGIEELLYTCPECGGVFLLDNLDFEKLSERTGEEWRELFDTRAASKNSALRGIFRFYELMAPVLEEEDIVYLGEGNTPIVEANDHLAEKTGIRFAFKNDGQNPSASFKDRGMACAFAYLKALVRKHGWDDVLTVCASTGDTSAAAALYASHIGSPLKSAVLLPHGKVTPQQLSQPLGSGATVLEIPGVFDDCMKVVENLAENYRVALLNSKNSWRILGQESYAFEIAQWYDWDLKGKCVFVPVGNAGNITAVMGGFLKLHRLGIIEELPRVFGVQSHHADPVYQYYSVEDPEKREYKPVAVTPSVAQAAMIGNPVSFPRVKRFAEQFEAIGGKGSFQVIQVTEQSIMDSMIEANMNGHIACTQGGECYAGLKRAKELGLIAEDEFAILDATAHALKFSGFQDMYFSNNFSPEFGVQPDTSLANAPELVIEESAKAELAPEAFTEAAAKTIANKLGLHSK